MMHMAITLRYRTQVTAALFHRKRCIVNLSIYVLIIKGMRKLQMQYGRVSFETPINQSLFRLDFGEDLYQLPYPCVYSHVCIVARKGSQQ